MPQSHVNVATDAAEDTDTNALVTATIAAKAGARHYIVGISISASAAPAAAVAAELKRGTTTLDKLQIPAEAFSPITPNYNRPLRGGINEAITLTLPDLGVGVTGTAVIRYFTVFE